MTARWTVRAATDRGPQAENRVLFGAPNEKPSELRAVFIYFVEFTVLFIFYNLRLG